MPKGRIRKMFPGGNTCEGFFSYYDYIMPQDEARKLIILKGGPGVGKSSFMRKMGMEMAGKGYDVEFMQCSSDNGSLDGVVIPAIKVALIDGTSPHVVDPKNPGAVDEIIHLGDFWDEEGIHENRNDIIDYGREITLTFARAYRYLKAAKQFQDDSAVIYGNAIDGAIKHRIAAELSAGIFSETTACNGEGRDRRLFASAITPDGLFNYLDTIVTTGRVYILKGVHGTGAERILEKVRDGALERGLNTESYYCGFNPYRLEHVVIPSLDVSLITSNEHHDFTPTGTCEEINLDSHLDGRAIEKHSSILEYNNRMFKEMINKAVETINRAKLLHDHMEAYYVPNMDFSAVQRCWKRTFARVLKYADKDRG